MRRENPAAILIVDDDKDMLDGLSELLAAKGYQVAAARDGREALDYLRDNPPPKLILLDIAMPRMDGWEFLRRKAQDRKLAGIPVVIMSGTETRPPGDHAFIPKPCNPEKLLDAVRRHSSPGMDNLSSS